MRTALLTLLLAPLWLADFTQACSFPHYLTRRPRWESQIHLNRRRTDVYWKFHERTVEMVDLMTKASDTTVQECVLEMPGQKYILQDTTGDTTHYTCIQPILRSEQVVQVRRSSASTQLDAEALCDDGALNLDPWPLVWPRVGDTYHACPLNGGYDFSITDHMHQETLCEKASLKPRLESECMTGEGLALDFRNFECRGGYLEMEVQQNLVCLGTWIHLGYSYTVLTDNDELWPKLWLLRFPVRHGPQFTAQLYIDLVADHTQSENYFELKLQQALYPSLCENEAYPCNDCEGHNNYYCQKTCHRCDALQEVAACEFDLPSRGEWVEVSHHGHRDITITASMIYADDLLPLQCFDLHTEAWFEDKNYKSLATLFKNGCKPRYTCVEFERQSSSILLYRLSQNLVWPHTLTLTGQDVCGPAQFQDDPSPLQGEFRSQHLKALVRKSTLNRPRPTVDCQLDGKFQVQAMYQDGAGNCSGYLDTCDSSHAFTLRTGTSCTGTVITETHRCLASFQQDDIRLVMTDTVDSTGESYCWAFHKDEWDSGYTLYLLYASDCHKDIGRQIRYYGYRGHIAQFTLTKGQGYLGSFPCYHQFPAGSSTDSPHWSSYPSHTHGASDSPTHTVGQPASTPVAIAMPTSAMFHQPTQKSTVTLVPGTTQGKSTPPPHSSFLSSSYSDTPTITQAPTKSRSSSLSSSMSTQGHTESGPSTKDPALEPNRDRGPALEPNRNRDPALEPNRNRDPALEPNRAVPPLPQAITSGSAMTSQLLSANIMIIVTIIMSTVPW